MKTKLFGTALLLVSLNVNAEAWVTSNQIGGDIVITDNVCYLNTKKFDALKEGYARDQHGKMIQGCWYYDNGTIHMVYEDKSQYAYPLTIFRKMQTW